MSNIKDYVEKNKERFLKELFDLIRIPSISSSTDHTRDLIDAAEYWQQSLLNAGADRAELYQTSGNPVVYGEKMIDPELPVVLVYAHYDVMPVDPLELWDSDPFEPVVKEGKIYARGADDDKGQGFMHAKAFEFMVKTKSLPCNVKFMIEGEEEIGSKGLLEFIQNHKELLKADIILASDTTMISPEAPSITTGLRGITYMQVELTGPNRDLHSGLYGGAVANPAFVLTRLLSSLIDDTGKVTIPGFYDKVREYSNDEREEIAKAPFNKEDYKKSLDVLSLWGEHGYNTLERVGIRPALDINGIWGGYIGEGTKTVIPSKAFAKVSMRLVPNQDSNEIAELFEKHIRQIAPETVSVDVKFLHGGEGYVSPLDSAGYKAAAMAIEESFGKKPVPVHSGGSIPIVASFEKYLGVKTILMGFGLESDAIHSPNENYPLWNFYKGIETLPLFYKHFTKVHK